jgi:hypothetical protein
MSLFAKPFLRLALRSQAAQNAQNFTLASNLESLAQEQRQTCFTEALGHEFAKN